MAIRWITTIVLALAVALAPAWGFAQSTTTPPDKPAEKKAPADRADRAGDRKAAADDKGKLPGGDRKFVVEALKGGLAEVELGKLASERASNDAVKQFGQRMVDEHSKAGDELKKLASDKGVDPPASLDAKHRRLHDRLSKLSGAEFDRAYVNEMVKDHRKDVREFKREADRAKDPDLKSWAAKTLPNLQDHLKQIERLRAQVKSAAARANGQASGRTDAKAGAKTDNAKSDKK